MTERQRTQLRGSAIGFVFQSFHLMPHRSVLDNVRMSTVYRRIPEPERRSRATEALKAVGLSHRSGFRPSVLSGGERQRVAIARALAGTPSILLCDEPTGNLDSANSAAILDLFRGLNHEGTTIVLITHDDKVAACGNRVLSVLDGTVDQIV
jgi:putative ABC transport system ATP-binding protein